MSTKSRSRRVGRTSALVAPLTASLGVELLEAGAGMVDAYGELAAIALSMNEEILRLRAELAALKENAV